MKSFFASILGLFLLLGCLVSCEHKAPTVQSVTFDTLTVDTICPLFHSYDKPACHLSIKMAKPEAQTPAEIMLAIESFISTLPKDGSFEEEANGSIESMVNAYVRDYIMQYLNEGHDAIGQHEGETEEITSEKMIVIINGAKQKTTYNGEEIWLGFVANSSAAGFEEGIQLTVAALQVLSSIESIGDTLFQHTIVLLLVLLTCISETCCCLQTFIVEQLQPTLDVPF